MFPPFSMTPLFAFVARSIFVIYFLFVSSCDCSLKRFIVIFFLFVFYGKLFVYVLWTIPKGKRLNFPCRFFSLFLVFIDIGSFDETIEKWFKRRSRQGVRLQGDC